MILSYAPSFMSLYTLNKKEIDIYLKAAVRPYSSLIELDELTSQVIYLLSIADPDIMTKFDPKKSRLNTFITNHIRYTVGHISQALIREKTVKGRKDLTQVLFEDINGINPDSLSRKFTDEDASWTIPDDTEADDYETQDIINVIRKRLPDNLQHTFKQKLAGFSLREIAAESGVTVPAVSSRMSKIQATVQKVYDLSTSKVGVL
jgi:RNA polymerase sigma factor (sigma-70 family)